MGDELDIKTFGKLKDRVDRLEKQFKEFQNNVYEMLIQIEDTLSSNGTIQNSIEGIKDEITLLKSQIDYSDSALGDHNIINQVWNSVEEIRRLLKMR